MILTFKHLIGWRAVGAIMVLVALSGTSAQGADTVYNATPKGIAIGGYDPVAYVVDRKARLGNPDFTVHWSGTTWHFANDTNRALFQNNPDTYAPAYGGWCAMGMAGGSVVEVDFVRGWSHIQGRLYLNVTKDINTRWRRGARRFIALADQEWPTVEPTILSDKAHIHRTSSLPDVH